MNRRQARELAMQALFARDVGQGRPGDALAFAVGQQEPDAETASHAGALVEGVLARLAELDRLIAAYARDWTLPRLAAVDRNVLRVALFELGHQPQTPAGAVISEAVEIAKRYGGEDSGRFVNGVLGAVHRDRTTGTG